MTTEQQDAVDDERRQNERELADARACAWSDFRKDYGVSGEARVLRLEHRAFRAGWDARGAEPAEEGPVRERCATEPVYDAPDPGMGLAAFVLDTAHAANADRGPGDADAWYALGRLYQEAARYRDEHGKARGVKPGKLTVKFGGTPGAEEVAAAASESIRRAAGGVYGRTPDGGVGWTDAPRDVPGEEGGASVDGVPWWRSKPRGTGAVATVPVQRDVASALVDEFGFVPMSARARIARAMAPLLEAAANDGSPHRPPQDEPTTEPFHPDGDRAARGDEGPTAADLEAWSSLRPGDVLGNVHKTASLDDPEHGQTWLELMVGWDESGPSPMPVVFVIRFGAGQWNPPEKWQPRHLLPGHRRRVLHAPDLSSAPVALRRLVYPHVAHGVLVLGPETLAGPERVGEHQHPRIIIHRGGTYVLADDAPAVPGVKVQTLRAAWVAGDDELTARIGDTVYAKVRKLADGGTVTARVPGEPRTSLFPACGFRVATAGVAYGPCQRPNGHASAHQDINGTLFNENGRTSEF